MSKKPPESLLNALISGEVVPFIGAGVSMSVKKLPHDPELDEHGNEIKDKLGETKYKSLFPSWHEFLTNAAKKLIDEDKPTRANLVQGFLDDLPPRYLEATQEAFDGLRQRQWYRLLSENFEIDIESADPDSLKLAKLIWQLGSNLILTTNVDLVLKWAHEAPHKVRILDTQEPEFADIQRKNWQPSRPTVLHLHGSIENKGNIVFTKNQYKDFYHSSENSAKLETLRSLFRQRTILFIGFSLDDLHILKELEQVDVIYKGGADSFYVLIREDEEKNPNIPKYMTPITFSEFGKPLEDLVENLSQYKSNKEKIKKGLPGLYEYKCVVELNSTFDGRETERGGFMKIKIDEDAFGGLEVEIDAKRVWAKNKGEKKPFRLKKEIPWKGEGNVRARGNKLDLVYKILDGKAEGRAEDIFEITKDCSLKYGTFTHLYEDGQGAINVKGKVEVREMVNNQDLLWTPKI
jgi:SIR2-like domain